MMLRRTSSRTGCEVLTASLGSLEACAVTQGQSEDTKDVQRTQKRSGIYGGAEAVTPGRIYSSGAA
jgi:hypothetical protein